MQAQLCENCSIVLQQSQQTEKENKPPSLASNKKALVQFQDQSNEVPTPFNVSPGVLNDNRQIMREEKKANDEYRRLSRSPKIRSPTTCLLASSHDRLAASGGAVLAPETQHVPASTYRDSVSGLLSIPETMALDEHESPIHTHCKNLNSIETTLNESKDVFDDDSIIYSEPELPVSFITQPTTSTQCDRVTDQILKTSSLIIEDKATTEEGAQQRPSVSPVLGKGAAVRNSPYTKKKRGCGGRAMLSNRCWSTPTSSQESGDSSESTNTNTESRMMPDINPSCPISAKIVNITLSPKFDSADTPSPSLIQAIPKRRISSQPPGSQLKLDWKSPKKYPTGDFKDMLDKQKRVLSIEQIPIINIASSGENSQNISNHTHNSLECHQINRNDLKISAGNQSPTAVGSASNIKSKLSKKSPTTNPPRPVMKTVSGLRPANASHQSAVQSKVTPENCIETSRQLLGGKTTSRATSVMINPISNVAGSNRGCGRAQSACGNSVAVSSSKLFSINPDESIVVTVKKNYKQTKLTPGSFIVSEKKGNVLGVA